MVAIQELPPNQKRQVQRLLLVSGELQSVGEKPFRVTGDYPKRTIVSLRDRLVQNARKRIEARTSSNRTEKKSMLDTSKLTPKQIADGEAARMRVKEFLDNPAVLIAYLKRSFPAFANYADDVAENALAKAYLSANTFNSDKGTLYTWINTIAKREMLDEIRKLRSRPQTSPLDPQENNSRYVSEKMVDKITDDNEIASVIVRALSKLDKVHRNVVILTLFGYSHSEVRDELSLPFGTVKSRDRDAKITLREIPEVLNLAISHDFSIKGEMDGNGDGPPR